MIHANIFVSAILFLTNIWFASALPDFRGCEDMASNCTNEMTACMLVTASNIHNSILFHSIHTGRWGCKTLHSKWTNRPNGPHWPMQLFRPLIHFLCDTLCHHPIHWNSIDRTRLLALATSLEFLRVYEWNIVKASIIQNFKRVTRAKALEIC